MSTPDPAIIALLNNPKPGMDSDALRQILLQQGYDPATLSPPVAPQPPAPEPAPKPAPLSDLAQHNLDPAQQALLASIMADKPAAPPVETPAPAAPAAAEGPRLPPKKRGRPPKGLTKADKLKLACAALEGGKLELADALEFLGEAGDE